MLFDSYDTGDFGFMDEGSYHNSYCIRLSNNLILRAHFNWTDTNHIVSKIYKV